jgi:transcriptional regulator with XRE-family HTH domain
MTAEKIAIRCFSCGLNQFLHGDHLCARCRRPFEALRPRLEAKTLNPKVEILQTLAPRLRCFRQVLGWSQQSLADRMGCPRNFISKIETGGVRPQIDTCIRLAEAFGVSCAELLDPHTDPDPWVREIASLLGQLSPKQRCDVLMAAQMVAAKRQRRRDERRRAEETAGRRDGGPKTEKRRLTISAA